MRRVTLFVILLAILGVACSKDSTHLTQPIRTASKTPLDDGGGGGDPGFGSGGGSTTPLWDGTWRGTLTVMLPGGGASQPCSLYVANGVVTGTYEGVAFPASTLDSLTTDEQQIVHSHVTLTVADAVFSCRFDRFYGFGSQSDVMTGWGYALLGGQQFQLYSWFCNDCTNP